MTTATPHQAQELERRLREVQDRIRTACERGARPVDGCRLLAVVKRVPDELVRALLGLGQTEVAENRVQALVARPSALREQATWHLIGHLQTNKARRARELFAAFHGLDSPRLASALGKASASPWPVFLQVNVAREGQKFGCAPEEAPALVAAVREQGSLQLRGLMAMAPYDPDPERARPHFRALRELSEELRRRDLLPEEARELSMGMSGDYQVAAEEGATVVRVGSALFAGLEDA